MTITLTPPPPPPASSPDNLELMLTEHFSAALEGQRGRALAAFQKHEGQEKAEGARRQVFQISRRALWAYTGVPSALAAGLALALTLQFVTPPEVAARGGKPVVGSFGPVSQFEYRRDIDGGVATLGDEPVRVIREQSVKTTEWEDKTNHAKYSQTVPTENVRVVRLNPF